MGREKKQRFSQTGQSRSPEVSLSVLWDLKEPGYAAQLFKGGKAHSPNCSSESLMPIPGQSMARGRNGPLPNSSAGTTRGDGPGPSGSACSKSCTKPGPILRGEEETVVHSQHLVTELRRMHPSLGKVFNQVFFFFGALRWGLEN